MRFRICSTRKMWICLQVIRYFQRQNLNLDVKSLWKTTVRRLQSKLTLCLRWLRRKSCLQLKNIPHSSHQQQERKRLLMQKFHAYMKPEQSESFLSFQVRFLKNVTNSIKFSASSLTVQMLSRKDI